MIKKQTESEQKKRPQPTDLKFQGKSRKIEKAVENWFTSIPFYISVFLGALLVWITKTGIAGLFWKGMEFYKLDLFSQFMLMVISGFVFFSIFYILTTLIIKLIQKRPSKIRTLFQKIFDEFPHDINKQVNAAILVLAIGFCTIFFINNILPKIDTKTWSYVEKDTLPVQAPVGYDFRIGSYETAQNLVASHFKQIRADGSYSSIYPPFVALINIPYLLLDENSAYLVHVGFIFLANIACIVLAALMARDYLFPVLGLEKFISNLISGFLFFGILIYTFSSYSFNFSIERGQTDIFALLLGMLTIWVLLKKPDSLWLQVILLSVATHLKIYPAVLFLILLKKHGKKLILPALAVNLVLIFILGPNLAFSFLHTITSGSGLGAGVGNIWTWIGSHSTYSFADYLARDSANRSNNLLILWPILTLLVLELWLSATFVLFKKNSPQNIVLFLLISIPLMDLFPSVSMDYKLVILSPAALLLFAIIIGQIVNRPRLFDYFQLGVILLLLLLIGRPFALSPIDSHALNQSASFFIDNKFLWSFALEGIIVWNIYQYLKIPLGEEQLDKVALSSD